jgi:ATP-dependent Clp protease protease subunit
MGLFVGVTIPAPRGRLPRPTHLPRTFGSSMDPSSLFSPPGGPIAGSASAPSHPGLDLARLAGGGRPVDPRAAVNYQRTREMTIDELLLENRVVFLIGEINHVSAARVIMQMLYLENQKRGQEINFYINSPGGSVDDTLAIYDTMSFISSEVATYCIGRAYSGGAVLLAAGQSGKRFILPHAQVMIHQPWGGVTGQTTDIQIQAEQIIKSKRVLNEILARHSGQSVEQVEKDGERDKYFSAEQAKAYGLVDEVFQPPKKGAK